MKIKELTETYSPSAVYLHGGPENLEGGHFKRGGKQGHDMGAVFFVEESITGYKHALGYAISRVKEPSGVYRVKINLQNNDVFDFTNPNHKRIAKEFLSPDEYQYWENTKGDSGYIDWAVIDEDTITEMGFKGVIIHERNAGQIGNKTITSVAIFDPKYAEIINFIPKERLLKKLK